MPKIKGCLFSSEGEPRHLGLLGAELEQEVAEIEQRLAASELDRARLQAELDRALARCVELEEYSTGQLAQALECSAAVDDAQTQSEEIHRRLVLALGENEELRQQLHASGLALQRSQAEGGALLSAVAEFESRPKLDESLPERFEELRHEVEALREEKSRLEDALKAVRECRRRGLTPRAEAGGACERCATLELRCRIENQRRLEAEERCQMEAKRRRTAEDRHRSAVEDNREDELQGVVRKQNGMIRTLNAMVTSLRAMVEELQRNHAKQAMQLYTLSVKARAVPQLFDKAIAGAEVDEVAYARLRQALELAHGHGRHCAQKAAVLTNKASTRSIRRRKLTAPPSWSIVRGAFAGVVVQKVSFKNGKREDRKLEICKEDASSNVRLRWAKKPFTKFPKNSFLFLSRVMLIGYGMMSRAWAMFDDVLPERCFSIFTVRRSFDFICPSEEDAQAFVVALSRLCACIQGWPVPGSIDTQSKFASAKGWCKLIAACRRKQTPLSKRFLDAIAKTHMLRAKEPSSAFEASRLPAASPGGSKGPPQTPTASSPAALPQAPPTARSLEQDVPAGTEATDQTRRPSSVARLGQRSADTPGDAARLSPRDPVSREAPTGRAPAEERQQEIVHQQLPAPPPQSGMLQEPQQLQQQQQQKSSPPSSPPLDLSPSRYPGTGESGGEHPASRERPRTSRTSRSSKREGSKASGPSGAG
mmetsp:Transcript_119934/g.344668  ORF Transcript_119934/g.344668 Transcript_119934/m.344668 type:complete len:707 (-) Transcript_119934:147-2267(-)